MKYILSQVDTVTPTIVQITLKPVGSKRVLFQPGQYATLSFKRRGRPTPTRCFSITNVPNDAGVLQFAFRVGGRFTRSLAELTVGSTFTVDGPFGEFVYDEDYDEQAVFMAGGIGITPIVSIIRSALMAGVTNEMTLLYSVRSLAEAAYAPILLALAAEHKNFKVIFISSRADDQPSNGQRVVGGQITSELVSAAANNNFRTTSFFICGPAGFSDASLSILKSQGVPPQRIFSEAFSQARGAKTSDDQAGWRRLVWSPYGLAASLFTVAFLAVMLTDLRAHADAVSTTKTTTQATVPATTSSTPSTDDTGTDDTLPTTTTPTTTNTNSTNTSTVTPTPTVQTNQPPVSSVS